MWEMMDRYEEQMEVVRLTNGEDIVVVKWRIGSHLANVFDGPSGREIDCFFVGARMIQPAITGDFEDALKSWTETTNTVEEW